jgi:hypothetical protein
LKHLSEASTYLYEIATPILYERVVVSAKDEGWLCNIDVSPLLQTRHTSKKLLRHTKHIEITSNFHNYRSKRCVHGYPVFDEEVGIMTRETRARTMTENGLATSLSGT